MATGPVDGCPALDICEQRTVCSHPQDVGVDDADVDEPPEEVLPSTPARTPHPVVGVQLIESVDPTHVFVIAANTDRQRQVDQLAVPPRPSHEVFAGVVRSNDERVPLVIMTTKVVENADPAMALDARFRIVVSFDT